MAGNRRYCLYGRFHGGNGCGSGPHFQFGQIVDRKSSKKGSMGKIEVGIPAVIDNRQPHNNFPVKNAYQRCLVVSF